jgi:hypothetical protein
MNNIHLRKSNQFSVIMKFFDGSSHPFFGSQKISFFHITNSNNAGSCIFNVVAPHATHTNDAFGKLITWWDKPFAKHMAWNNEKACCSGCAVEEKFSPAFWMKGAHAEEC